MTKLNSVCVYCGSSNDGNPSHRTDANRFGGQLAAAGIALVYGGGRVGLMGAVADGAIAGGGTVVGIIPEHLMRAEVGHGQVTELHVVPSMHVRKEMMFARSDAFVILPGGPGTLDEMFEILTWRQLGLHDKPLVIVNLAGYWDGLIALIDGIIAAKYARPSFRAFYTVVDSIDAVLPALRAAPPARTPPQPEKL
ncbi:MAG: TIGR00730 family Rossman fold protein [Rhodospirillales bacterium]|nr:TIGR00730 family Rossman fold protein [Rhodospirillales bacterium]